MERRRGDVLERALLDAACAELAEKGYAKFTIDAVAARAGTSTPVLYRRWSDKRDLVRAAVGHTARKTAITVPDSGSLREDVLALMRQANHPAAGLVTMISVQLGGYFQETCTSPIQLLETFAAELPLFSALDDLYRRAADRGELDPERITARMKTLPFDLLRAQLLMTLQPMADADLEEIVDTLFLPLINAR